MRARSLKPSIFRNEHLAVADPLYTVIFAGLWCSADREGRLEDRPAKIHLEINPGRSQDGTRKALDWLAVNGFIVRYQVDGARFIQVVNFAKHQNPHVREPASTIPAPDEHCAGTVPAGLTPDSGLLTPDSPFTDTAVSVPTDSRAKSPKATRLPEDFELTDERRAVAEAERLPADRTFAKFVDYWRSASGAKARKIDWDATWRNWCRTEADRSRGINGSQQPLTKFDRIRQRQEEAERRATR